ncbi:hypothetical protein HY625_01810 [Candidatus Uhrbacteria bacterium]|nr:hypothetical protein [Candidatus Uhrbacteria bacterium]
MSKYRNNTQATVAERKRYVLGETRDYVILAKLKFLASQRLSKTNRMILRLLRTQLEHDWRKPLIKFLDQLLKKYG